MTPNRTHRRAAGLVAVAAAALAIPATASATVTPVFDAGAQTLTITSDGDGDAITVAAAAGELTLNGNPIAGDPPSNDTVDVIVSAGDGTDTVTINLAANQARSITVDGGPGNDIVTGSADADALRGGDGNDRVTGFQSPAGTRDDMEGGNGNDVLVWNPGDGSDTMDGDAGADDIELNGGNNTESFEAASIGNRVLFERVSPGPFELDGGTVERLVLNANGGDDTMTSDPGLTVPVLLNGGVGIDTLIGGGAADFVNGGDDNDILRGGPGPDRLVGDRGGDAMTGGDGDDTLVWNNGDGSDSMDGEAGLDRIEVNGAAAAGDAFTIAPNGARAKFDRTNLGPFTLDIGSSEALDLRGQGGDDTFTAQPGTGALLAVTADGGSGNDTITGAEEADSFFGGAGNDTLTGGAGPDLLDGQDGDDALRARDGQSDLLRGGAGTDNAQTDVLGTDVWDSIESVDAPAVTPPPVVVPGPAPDTRATAARIGANRAAVRIRRGRASTRLAISCPAAEAGGCNGTVTLVSAKAVRIGSQRVIAVLGSARYRLDAGERRTITVRLPKGLRRLATRGAIAAKAQTVTRDAAGNTAVGSRNLSLRLPRQR